MKINDGHLIDAMKEMSPTFGAGYPGKTWREAACEVAWNAAVDLGLKTKGICVPCFMKGGSAKKNGTEHWSIYHDDFPAFRSAFMRRLADNERREA